MDYSRLTQGLSLGLRSGLSPETSLELTKDLISQPVTLERLRKASSILDSGETFSRALTESGLFGGMEGRLITISFYSGSSDETFRRLSRQYTERSIDLISQAVSIVEPTIVILLSLLVGLVLLSVMMPLLGILSDLQCKVVTAWNFSKAAEQNFSKHFSSLSGAASGFILHLVCGRCQQHLRSGRTQRTGCSGTGTENGAIRTYALTGTYPKACPSFSWIIILLMTKPNS